MLVAASIVYVGAENIVGARLHRRTLLAFAIGLVHGFGFSFIVKPTLQFAGSHVLASVLSFNLGVTLSQLLLLVVSSGFCSRALHQNVSAEWSCRASWRIRAGTR